LYYIAGLNLIDPDGCSKSLKYIYRNISSGAGLGNASTANMQLEQADATLKAEPNAMYSPPSGAVARIFTIARSKNNQAATWLTVPTPKCYLALKIKNRT